MADEPENLVLQYLRRIDAKVDRLADDIMDLKHRLSLVGEGLAGLQRRVDRFGVRLDRIERCLDLVVMPH